MRSGRRDFGERKPQPLRPDLLRAIAIRYVERYQTTRQRLLRLLQRKLRQRGWEEGAGPPDLEALVGQMVALGYVNDEAFAEARARSLARRGMGHGRIEADLQASGIDAETRNRLLEAGDPWQAALDFARRKRLGPFGAPIVEPKQRQRQLAAFARAGHPRGLAARILGAASVDELAD